MSMTPKGYDRFSTLSPQQNDIFNQLSSSLMGQLGGKDKDTFEAPYLREFWERTIPGLAEKFSGVGAGAQSSSAFTQSLGQAGAGLSENLASLGLKREQGAMDSLAQMLGINTEGLVKQGNSWWQDALIGLSGGLGKGFGSEALKGLAALFEMLGGGKGSSSESMPSYFD